MHPLPMPGLCNHGAQMRDRMLAAVMMFTSVLSLAGIIISFGSWDPATTTAIWCAPRLTSLHLTLHLVLHLSPKSLHLVCTLHLACSAP